MATSVVPDAIDALVALWDAALADVEVGDGAPLKGELDDWLAVGYSPTSLEVVEAWTQEPRGLGQQGREERFDIVCSLASTSGNPSMKERRDRAFALLAAAETSLRAAPTASGTVRFSEVTSGSLLQAREDGKTKVGIEFRVTCQARV